MDIQKLYADSEKELNETKSKIAVLNSDVKRLATELNLDVAGDLKAQAVALRDKLVKEKEEKEKALEIVVSKLESINLSSDGETTDFD